MVIHTEQEHIICSTFNHLIISSNCSLSFYLYFTVFHILSIISCFNFSRIFVAAHEIALTRVNHGSECE